MQEIDIVYCLYNREANRATHHKRNSKKKKHLNIIRIKRKTFKNFFWFESLILCLLYIYYNLLLSLLFSGFLCFLLLSGTNNVGQKYGI